MRVRVSTHSPVGFEAEHISRRETTKQEASFQTSTSSQIEQTTDSSSVNMMPTVLQPELIHQSQTQAGQKVKLTKVRRTRQPRNPLLSVARRNERERNRVKMVNNGFALLREHLPVEDLQACEQSGSDTPTPDGGSTAGQKAGKAKKYSKVETLRAAIQRIKMLEELIRSTEPSFESINLTPSAAQLAYDEEPPLSVCEPLSCGSSHSNSTSTMHISSDSQHTQQAYQSQQQEQFVKLEPQPVGNLPSPQASQTSHTSGLNQYQTQVHHLHNHHQQPQHHHQQEASSHTHLWIQQHQNSFMEQQQYQLQQQQQQINNHNWYPHQQMEASQQHKSSNWFVSHTESPEQQTSSSQHLHSHAQQLQQQQQPAQQPQHHLHHQSQLESPAWFGSPPAAPQSAPQPMAFGHHHQISLYSQ